jgi:hypothetical protein
MRNTYETSVGNLKGRDHLGGVHTDERIILEWIL